MTDSLMDGVSLKEEEECARTPSVPAKGSLLTVTKQEWEQIEDVPVYTRSVGIMFQRVGQELRAASNTVGMGRVLVKKKFNIHLYSLLLSGGSPVTPSAKDSKQKKRQEAASRISAIQEKTAQVLLEKDLQKAKECEKASTPPRREAFSSRLESFVFSTLLWLRRQMPATQSVAASKLSSWLRDHVEGLPADLEEELRDAKNGRGSCPLAALEELCDREEALTENLCFSDLSLHEEQATLVRELRASFQEKTALLLRYQTPPSGGKSSATALLGAALADLKDSFVIYACYSRPVRVDVCKHLMAASVPFAICVQGIASPSFSCYFSGRARKPHTPPPPDLESRVQYSMRLLAACDRKPIALVCDLATTKLLLLARTQDVLLFDEPTADFSGTLLRDVKSILRLCPSRTVLMSATIPPFSDLRGFVHHVQERHPGVRLVNLQSSRLPRSVTACNPEGRVLAPHEFGATLEDIRKDGHLKRFYSPQVLRAMAPQASELGFQDLLTYDLIREACLRLLETRASGGIGLPKSVLHPALDLMKSCTEHAQLLPGTTLVVTDDLRVIERSIGKNLEDVPSLRRLLRASQKAVAPCANKKSQTLEEKEEVKQGWVDAEEGLLDKKYVINSKAHLSRFGAPKTFPEKLYRPMLYIPTEVLEGSREEHVEAALCGVLYLGSEDADAAYEAASQTLAERAQESFVAGGRSLIYGLNLPFDRLVISCEGLTRSELTQLCGRVGRTGRASAKAEIVFLSKGVARQALGPGEHAENNSRSVSELFNI